MSLPLKVNTVSSQHLAAYSGTWTRAHAAHLVRRSHMGNSVNDVNRARLRGSAVAAVDDIVSRARSTVLPEAPQWFNQNLSSNIDHMYDIQFRWMNQFYSGGLLERMLLFWSNHFAVSYNNMNDLPGKASNSYVSHMYKYVTLLHTHGLGDYRQLVRDVSKNSAMLYYLNNYNNSPSAPNQDFARELLELFTTGRVDADDNPNYSEQDVAEVARAVTGWRVNNSTLSGFFDASRFDNSSKTIFGKTGNFDLDGVIDLLFEEKGDKIAWFICSKLYSFFVSAEPDRDFIKALADYCLEAEFNISEVLRVLFTSAHFYEERFMGCRIKSPAEVFIGFLRHLEIEPGSETREFIRTRMEALNEEFLRPETVFGWDGYNPPGSDGLPGHYAWLNTNLLPSRWSNLTDMIYGRNSAGGTYNPIALVSKISDPDDPFAVARDLAEHLLAIPLHLADIREVEDNFAGNMNNSPYLEGKSPQEINLTKILLGSIPWYEWRSSTTGSGTRYYTPEKLVQLHEYLSYLIQLPSYQHL